MDKGDLEKVHASADKISEICMKLPDMAPKANKAAVEKLCKETIDLLQGDRRRGGRGQEGGDREGLQEVRGQDRRSQEADEVAGVFSFEGPGGRAPLGSWAYACRSSLLTIVPVSGGQMGYPVYQVR